MNTAQIVVTLGGFALILWIVWYFWLWRSEGVTVGIRSGVQEVDITVKGGYQPALITARAGQLLRLNFTRRETSLCGEEVVLPDFGKRAHLPENQGVSIEITPATPGEYTFTCGMNMYKGRLVVK